MKFILAMAILTHFGCAKKADDKSPKTDVSEFQPDVSPVESGNWYKPGVRTSWQWQLKGDINTSYDVDLYDIDLFDAPQSVIDALHAAGRKVICYFSAGSSENWRDDFSDFPRDALGSPLDGWDGERWLDIRNTDLISVMTARLDLAVEKKCDGVEPDNVDGFANESGFALTALDQLAYNKWLANEAHTRGLSIALKNDPDQVTDLLEFFDFSVVEQCHVYEECEAFAPFIASGKAVLNAEYGLKADEVCSKAVAANLRTLILPLELDDSSRISCD